MSFAGDMWSSARTTVADDGEYVVVSMPPNQRCSFGVWGCSMCTVILRRNKVGVCEPVAFEHGKDGTNPFAALAKPLTTTDELAIEAIIQSAERKKQQQAAYDGLMELLRAEPEQEQAPPSAAQPVQIEQSIVLQLEVARR